MTKPLLSLVLLLFATLYGVTALGGAMQGMEDAFGIQQEQLERMRSFLGPVVDASAPNKNLVAAPSTISFSNPAAQKFFVDGTKIPDGINSLRYSLISRSLNSPR